uniref:Uncharacterized protein n=1 Tax=Oryza meridionalis TaxID=40149 RepID=A0A0E0CSS9_9ORYZ
MHIEVFIGNSGCAMDLSACLPFSLSSTRMNQEIMLKKKHVTVTGLVLHLCFCTHPGQAKSIPDGTAVHYSDFQSPWITVSQLLLAWILNFSQHWLPQETTMLIVNLFHFHFSVSDSLSPSHFPSDALAPSPFLCIYHCRLSLFRWEWDHPLSLRVTMP